MRWTATDKPRKPEPDERQVDLEDYLDIPAFLLAENRPKDLQARTDARIRAFYEKQRAGKASGQRRQIPRRLRGSGD